MKIFELKIFGLVLIQNIDNQSKNQYLIDEGFNFDNLQPTKKNNKMNL